MRARAKPKTAPTDSSGPIVLSSPFGDIPVENRFVELMAGFIPSSWLWGGIEFGPDRSTYWRTPCSQSVARSLENREETEIMIIKGMALLLADPDERLDSLFSLYDSHHGR